MTCTNCNGSGYEPFLRDGQEVHQITIWKKVITILSFGLINFVTTDFKKSPGRVYGRHMPCHKCRGAGKIK